MSTAKDTSDTFKVGPNEPTVTNEHGGMQAKNIYAFDLIDPDALMELAQVMGEGARKYAPDNWRKIPPKDHYAHLMAHLVAWRAGDRQDNHLGHALARAVMLFATDKAGAWHG